MLDITVVDPKGWEYDLHSIYSAYIGYFQLHAVPWYARSWGYLFASFPSFLEFSWPVITVTDVWTHRPHIVTRHSSVCAFLKMIKTRFGEILPQPPNILVVSAFESSPRPLRTLNNYAAYKRLHTTLPAIEFSAFKARVRAGDLSAMRALWGKPLKFLNKDNTPGQGGGDTVFGDTGEKDKIFLAIEFKWDKKDVNCILEWGYVALQCGDLNALSHWPPGPDSNYRGGHYIVAENMSIVRGGRDIPSTLWHFGEAQIVPKVTLSQIIQAVISSLASPDAEMTPNILAIVARGASGHLARLEELGIKLPHNVLILDTATYERALNWECFRRAISDVKSSSKARTHEGLTLRGLPHSFIIPKQAGSNRSQLRGHRVSASLSTTTSMPFGTNISLSREHNGTSSPDWAPYIQTQAPMFPLNQDMYEARSGAFTCLLTLHTLLESKNLFKKVRGPNWPVSNSRATGVMAPPKYSGAYLGEQGYLGPPEAMHTGRFTKYSTLNVPGRKNSTYRRHSSIYIALPTAQNLIYPPTPARSGKTPHSAQNSESESCTSTGTSSTGSVVYDLSEELGQMWMERNSRM